jgi:signal transduction histidine kinase/ligand-binding sensor domain-containing protein
MRDLLRTFLIVAVGGPWSIAAAQQQPLFDRIGMAEGLPGREVLALFQDRQGLVWIGTANGLARHEGPRIRTWHHDRKDAHSLSNEQVNCMAQCAKGLLWVGTANGISAMDAQGAGFRRYTLPALDADITRANRVLDILPDVGHRLWVSTELGLFGLDPATGAADRVRIDAGPWQDMEGPLVIKHSMLRDTLRAGIWLGTTQGLAFHHLPSGTWYHAGHDPEGWGCFTTAGASVPTLLRDGSLLWFDVDHYALMHADLRVGLRTVDHLNGERMRFTPRFLAQDSDGSIWLSTWTHRLYRLSEDLGAATHITDTEGLPGAMVQGGPYCTLLDRWGTRWFGTRDGVALLAPWRQQLQVLRPLPGVTLQGVLAQVGDTLLLGTLGHGLLLYHPPSDRHELLAPLGAQVGVDPDRWKLHVKCALHLEGRRYLVGTARGLLLLDLARQRLEPIPPAMGLPASLDGTSITCLVRDAQDRIWIGTWSRGLFRLDGDGAVRHFHRKATDPAYQLPMNGVLDILPGTNNDVWVGLNDGGGLVRLPGGEGPAATHFQAQGSDALYAVVTCLAQGPDGAIWAGTHQGGVDRIDPRSGAISTFTRVDGLPSDRIGRLCFDAQGDLWAITSGGPARLPQGADRFVPFEPPQGIAPGDFLSGLSLLANDRLSLVNKDHLLLVGSTGVPTQRPVPEVLVVKATHPGGELLLPGNGPPLRLPYDRRALSMEAAALGDATAGQVQFAYMVPGHTEDFRPMGYSGRLDLIDLPRGSHRILLIASTDGRQWSSTPTAFEVEVLPPFWTTWWFRGLLGILIVALALIMVRTYVRDKLEAQRVAFEREQALLAERIRIAGDMHDDMGAGLSALKLQGEMALRTETDPDKRRQLAHFASNAGELIASMRQIIWTLDEGQGSLEDLVAYSTNHARQYLSGHGIACVVNAAGPWPSVRLSSEQRRSIFLVIKEALHNVVKHAGATALELTFSWEAGALHARIADNGRGLPPGADGAGGNGLQNMRRRMEGLGGSFHLDSPAGGAGTRIAFSVPLGQKAATNGAKGE